MKKLFGILIIFTLLTIGLCGCTRNISDSVHASVYYSGNLYKRQCPCPEESQWVFILSKFNSSDYPNYLVKKNVKNLDSIDKEEFYSEGDIGDFYEGQSVYISGEKETGWAYGINNNSTNFINVLVVDKILSEKEYNNR